MAIGDSDDDSNDMKMDLHITKNRVVEVEEEMDRMKGEFEKMVERMEKLEKEKEDEELQMPDVKACKIVEMI